ncbi:peptidase S8 and S53, subtilisin, kexin, sedolisin [Seminavis robusta]|uniref:subtilisin n=1 Tax=Seminavis robusta TaxID=568900 RepID=A0A9N8D6Z0_9STRA|nr:peptidase S8 and S53, subtilisin, kexin, sedolisin [Seminavis robusta]|eukprot:Sro3_g002560.1 peptidase S8 and S53, subtilisin, kexin, sedolisin (124) ;mRNA; r:192319-192690
MCVSATSVNDEPAYYTNFGNSAIEVAAPGGGLGLDERVWALCSQTSLVISGCRSGWFMLGLLGTSMASPHVAAMAALIVEDVGQNPRRVKAIIQNSADDLGDNGNDPYFGKGRMNVAAALGLE